jgi:putative membrane protein
MKRLTLLAVGAALAATQSFGAGTSEEFLKGAIQTDIAEIQLGELAKTKGASEGVRDFGETLVEDHEKAMANATKLAKSLGVQTPTAPKPDAQQHYTMLSRLSGAEFDRHFTAHMIEGHQKAVKDAQEQAEAGDNAEVAKLARERLPAVQEHLRTAQSLETKVSAR